MVLLSACQQHTTKTNRTSPSPLPSMKTINPLLFITLITGSLVSLAAAEPVPSTQIDLDLKLNTPLAPLTNEPVARRPAKVKSLVLETVIPSKLNKEQANIIHKRHQKYLHQKKMFHMRQSKQVERHHASALGMQEQGHHGHTYEKEYHLQNLLIIPFGTKINAAVHMQHHFHERFLSHAALTELTDCQQKKNREGGKPVGDRKHMRRLQQKAAKECRTKYERCVDNSLEPHYKTMNDRKNDKIDDLIIRNAAKHCDHLSSVDKNLLVEHRKNFVTHYDGASNSHGSTPDAPMQLQNPQIYHGLVPHSDFIGPYLDKMFPADDYTSSHMRHCMQHRLTHREWHDEHGASNPYSYRLAQIHCHHDLHGFYDREHPYQSLEATAGQGLRQPPHTAPPQHLHSIHKRHRANEKQKRRRANKKSEL